MLEFVEIVGFMLIVPQAPLYENDLKANLVVLRIWTRPEILYFCFLAKLACLPTLAISAWLALLDDRKSPDPLFDVSR